MYVIIYGYEHEDFTVAATQRAYAAHLRDQSRENPDWPAIQALLVLSYEAMLRATAAQPMSSL